MTASDPRGERRRVAVRDGMASFEARRVVVTGGAGFIGHHLVAALVRLEASVLAVDDLSAGVADRLPDSVDLEVLDVTKGDVDRALGRWRPDVVYHLAAQVSVPRGEELPEEDLRVNGLGTLRVVRAAKAAGAGRIVFTSSGGAVYGERRIPATERSQVRPLSVYGIHKLLGEEYVAASRMSYAIARPSNVYGPGQDASGEGAVVAVYAGNAREGRPLVVHGNGLQERDFLHVTDLVDGLLRLGAAEADGIWNVSAGSSTTVRELAAMAERVAARPLGRTMAPRRPADVNLSRIANGRLRSLGWSARVDLEAGLKELVVGPA